MSVEVKAVRKRSAPGGEAHPGAEARHSRSTTHPLSSSRQYATKQMNNHSHRRLSPDDRVPPFPAILITVSSSQSAHSTSRPRSHSSHSCAANHMPVDSQSQMRWNFALRSATTSTYTRQRSPSPCIVRSWLNLKNQFASNPKGTNRVGSMHTIRVPCTG